MEVREVISEILSSWLGRVAITLLLIQLGLAFYALLFTDYARLSQEYMDVNFWSGRYPRHVPPCWAVARHAPRINVSIDTSRIQPSWSTSHTMQQGIMVVNSSWVVNFAYRGDAPPSDTLLLVTAYASNRTVLTARVSLYLERPDGTRIPLVKNGLVAPGKSLVIIGAGKGIPLLLSSLREENPLYTEIVSALKAKYGDAIDKLVKEYSVAQIVWMAPQDKTIGGEYKLVINTLIVGRSGVSVKDVRVRVSLATLPNCYGLMGTDSAGRPIELGILLGYPWAFVISFYVTVLTVLIGGFYGILAGLAEGWKSELLMRIVDVVYSIPLLPFLIAVVIATNNRSIWLILSVMVALLWTGPVIVVRSMTLQIKEQPYIESARAIGASRARIIFRYILPQILPYLATLIVLGIPDPILTEAALAFLGLSDPTIPTWGKMLEWAWNEHAVNNGWWWSFLFPGLTLAIYCASFLMIGRVLEPIVSPRLRR